MVGLVPAGRDRRPRRRTRIVPLTSDTQIGFGDLNLTTILFGVPFAIYYMLLGVCGTYHMANGLLVADRVFGLRAPKGLRMGPGFWPPVRAEFYGSALSSFPTER